MLSANDFRLNWHHEFTKLAPYFKGRGGVVRLEYKSDDAAAFKFNHLLKEDFGCNDSLWRSLRIDHKWFTTRRAEGVIDQIDRLLTEAGFPAALPPATEGAVNILTDVAVTGNMTANISELHVNYGDGQGGRAFHARAVAIFDATRRYVECGGRFMVIVNDMPHADQTEFWEQVWNAGLSAAVGADALLVIHAGPKAKGLQHSDSPVAGERIILPDTVEEDTERDYHFFDDISDAFDKAGVESSRVPASVHLENNRASILQINMKLSAAIMSAKKAQELGK